MHVAQDGGGVEEQLRGLARRQEQTERSLSENNRAISRAAEQISFASRGQAQAFGVSLKAGARTPSGEGGRELS